MALVDIDLDEFETRDLIEELLARKKNNYFSEREKMLFLKLNLPENNIPEIKTLVNQEKFNFLMNHIDDITLIQLESLLKT